MLKVVKVIAISGLTASLLAACSSEQAPTDTSAAPSASGSVTESAQTSTDEAVTVAFRTFLEENYAVDMARYPFSASYRGIKTNHDQWNSVTEEFQDETRAINEARLQQLAKFDRDALSSSDRLSYDLYQAELQRFIASDEFRHHKFVTHQFRGPHTQVASNLINVHGIADVADAEAYIGRLNNVATWFDGVIEQLAIRTEKDMLLADWQYPQMIESARNIITGVPFDAEGEDSTLWQDFQAKLAALEIEDATRERLLADARTALVDVVEPSYKKLIAALAAQAEQAPDADGVWKFADGDKFYAERLRWFTTTDLTADEVHTIGLQEVDRIQDAMHAIMEEVEFEGSLAEFFEFMRNDPQFYYPNTDEGRAAYLADANTAIDTMRARLGEQFGVLPKAKLKVKRVEAFREKSAGKAFYQRPPADASRPGIYYANLYDMNSMPRYQLEALAYHEGVPGHHMQLAIAVELENIPEFQRYATFTAFSEGWGLYTEEVAADMGFYEDPYSDFGRLAMELWRACRLVVDTGLHSKRWTREEAIAYLIENTPNSAADSTKAIERYIAMPGQATAYLIGKLKIMELRERAQTALGEQFDIRAFHDEILGHGPVPLSLLEANIDRLIAETLAANA